MGQTKIYDVGIIGGGVVGTAIPYVLSNYTNVGSIFLLEKYSGVGQLNSGVDKNSQTLHFGDIETNYRLDKALQVKKAGTMVANYACIHGLDVIFQRLNKMVLAVGPEVPELLQRFTEFKPRYSGLELLDRNAIAKLEPKIVEGRDSDEEIMAIDSPDGHAISFQELSRSFMENTAKSCKGFDISLGTSVKRISRAKLSYAYLVETNKGSFMAKTIIVAAGSHSLVLAHRMNLFNEYTLLPIAGSFYISGRVLNGKVYTMQDPDIPFAAPHGDPPFHHPDQTRWGPTAKLIPFLERHSPSTFFDFLEVLPDTPDRWLGLLEMTLFNRKLSAYMAKNLLYDLPVIGKELYLQKVKKIVPTMKYRNLQFGKGIGGLRPQMINTEERRIIYGLKLLVDNGIIFNIAPSPGGSACLQNAKENVIRLVAHLNTLNPGRYSFDEDKFKKELEAEIYSGAA